MISIKELCFEGTLLQVKYENQLKWVCVFLWIAGMLGNLVNLVVFGHKHMLSPINRILWWLSISDLFVLVSLASYLWSCGWCSYIDNFYPDFGTHSYYGAKILLFSFILLQIFHTVVVGLNITLAFWRYLAVAYPLQSKIQCDYRSVRLTVAGLYALSFVLCLPVLFAFAIQEDYYVMDGTGVPRFSKTPNYIVGRTFEDDNYNYFVYCVVLRLVPFITLTIISVMLILAVIRTNRSRQRLLASGMDTKHKQINLITRVIYVILIMFLITEIPMSVSGILWLLINIQTDMDTDNVHTCETMLIRLQPHTLMVNSGYSIFCYLILSTQYNETLKLLLTGNLSEWVRRSKREVSVTQQLDTQLESI